MSDYEDPDNKKTITGDGYVWRNLGKRAGVPLGWNPTKDTVWRGVGAARVPQD